MITGILPSWNAATGSLLSAASRSVSRVWRDPVETGTLARSRIGALSVADTCLANVLLPTAADASMKMISFWMTDGSFPGISSLGATNGLAAPR